MSFELFLKKPEGPSLRRRLIYVLSISLHLALIGAAGIRSLWHVDEISPRGVTVTFMSGVAAPPPPPPPPPAPVAKKVTATRIKPRPPQVARVEPPEPVQPREPEGVPDQDSGEEGEPESVATGIPSGGVAGVTGALAAVEQPPPPPQRIVEVAPILLPPSVGTSQRISDVNDPAFRPTLPPALNRAGVTVRGLLRICVSTEGRVTDVKFLRSGDPAVDAGWIAVIRRWRYKPLITNGRPTPFCHPLMLEVRALG